MNDYGVNLDEAAQPSEDLVEGIHIKNTGNLKFVHMSNTVSLQSAREVLEAPGTDMVQLAPAAKRFGLKGRAPRITNQPNAKFDFGA